MSSKTIGQVVTFAEDLIIAGSTGDNASLITFDESVTAHAGGGQASAYQISKQFTQVSVCATALDSLKLPNTGNVGAIFTVINSGAAECAVYPYSGGSIDSRSVNALYPIYNGSVQEFLCTGINTWQTLVNGTRYIDIAEQAGYHWADSTTRADAPGGALTIDASWHDLSGLSGYIPASAHGQIVHFGLYCYENDSTNSEDYFHIRTTGYTEPQAIGWAGDANRTSFSMQWPAMCQTAANGSVEYTFSGTPDLYGIWIVGWWVVG